MLLSPIFVENAPKIFDQLGSPEALRTYDAIKNFGNLSGLKVQKGDHLFPRLKAEEEIAYIAEMMAGPKEKAAA
jgi:methionyl-tRNA synthetase